MANIDFARLFSNLFQRDKENSVARVHADIQQPNWIQNFVTRAKNTIGIPSSINAPIQPGTPLYSLGKGIMDVNQFLTTKLPGHELVYDIPKKYGTQAGEQIASGIKQIQSGQPSNLFGVRIPAAVAAPAKIGLGVAGILPGPTGIANVIGSYAMEGAERASAPVFGKDSLATSGIGLMAAIAAPGGTESDIAKAEKFASKLSKEEKAAKIVEDVAKSRGAKNMLEGLMGESGVVTKFRRKFGVTAEDAYGKIKETPGGQQFDDFMRKSPTSVKDKVNIFDYLRTPDRVLKKIGLEKQATQLRTAWDSYLEELPKEVNRVTEWAKQVPKESNRIIFKYLDGQIGANSLEPGELRVANEIKDYLGKFADRLGLPKDKRISSYITHIFERDAKGVEFPEEIASLIRENVAGSVYDPFVQKRMGKLGYVEDTWRSLDAYIKRGLRKVHMDQALEETKRAAEGLEDSQFKYVKTYIDKVNLRPSDIDNLLDNAIKASPIGYRLGARPVAFVTQRARQMVYRGLLGLNVSSALRNLSQGANTYAELGEKYTILGYAKVALNFPKLLAGEGSELHAVGVLRDGFIQDRNLAATKQLLQKTDEGLFWFFNLAEKINRGAAFWGAKARALKKGLSETEAIAEAKDIVRKTQFTFGNVDTPLALQGDLMKTIAQMQSYTVKQAEFLGEKVAAKDLAGITRYIGANLLFGLTIGKLFGWEPKDMIPSVRLGVPPTLQLPQGLIQATTQNDEDKGLIQRIVENPNVQKGLINYIPAGSQLRKTFQGLEANQQGGVMTPSGRLRFPTEPSFKNILFGPNVTPEAKEYYKNPQPLGDSQTKQYTALIVAGMSPKEAYSALTANRDRTQKVQEALGEKGFNLFDFVKGVFGGKKEEEQAAPTDTLLSYVQKQKQQDEDQRLVTEILSTAQTPEQAEAALKKLGVSMSYEQASLYVIKNMEVDIRADFLKDFMGKLGKEEYGQAITKFAEEKVITNSVIDEWVDDGTITESNGDMLKNFIKLRAGKKLTGRKKAVPKLKIPKMKKSQAGSIKLSVPKKTFKPLKIKFNEKF